jgi:endonuclease/exonuclease/phosphatase family metal-dependent hydrolase
MKILNWNTHPNNNRTSQALDMFDDLLPDVITLQEVSPAFFDEIKAYSIERDMYIDQTLDWVRRGIPYYLVTLLKDPSVESQSLPYETRRNGPLSKALGWKETLNYSVSELEAQTVINGHLEHHAGPSTRRRQLDEMLNHLGNNTNIMGVDLNQWFPFEKRSNRRRLRKHNLTDIVRGRTISNGLQLDGIIVSEDLAQREYDFEKQDRHGSDHYPLFVEFYE